MLKRGIQATSETGSPINTFEGDALTQISSPSSDTPQFAAAWLFIAKALFPAGSGRLEASNIADSDGQALAIEIFQKGNRVFTTGTNKVAK